jgi:aminoglycoside phosphotransferase (APT) family kinase protein
MTSEVPLEGGSMTRVVRVGDTVRRSAGQQSAAVQALLRHLEAKGVEGAPRALGFDDQGREIVTFIDGELGFVWDDDVLPTLGALIRRLHDAAALFDYLPYASSWIGPIRAPVETICHNDVVPWNTVYRNRMPIALIDWDAAAPGPRAWDLAYAAAAFIPLTHPDDAFNSAKAGWSGAPTDLTHRTARLHSLMDGYGMVLDSSFLELVIERLLVMNNRIQSLADAGNQHEVNLVKGGWRTSADQQITWIRTNMARLVGG